MTAPNPLREALARLAEETRAAEATLDRLNNSGASFAEQFVAAANVTHARRAWVEAASGRRDGVEHIARSAALGDGAQILADALAGLPEPEPEPEPEAEPESDDPLAALFR